MEELKDILESRGIKPTYQRLAIFKYLHDHKVHPTVERLYRHLIKLIPTISRTTIYNTLSMFVNKGLAKPLLISPTEIRYDADMSMHHHFCCEKCGKIEDVFLECENARKGELHGNIINEVHGYFSGICRECRTH